MTAVKVTMINPGTFNDSSTYMLPYNELIARTSLETFINDKKVEFLSTHDATPSAEVYFFSCYVWNWNFNNKLAINLKKSNPDTLCIAGGPHINYGDPHFFSNNPHWDLISHHEMETVLPLIMDGILNNDLTSIPGTRTSKSLTPLGSHAQSWVSAKSPYLQNKTILRQALKYPLQEGKKIMATWETARGCPYSCQFCDWGSYTNSRLRAKSLDTIEAEIKLFSALGVEQINCIDANFGILGRDKKIVRAVGESKMATGFPKAFTWIPTKSSIKRVTDIALISNKYHLDHKVVRIDIQSTNPAILQTIQRENIPYQKLEETILQLSQFKNVGTGLIMGLPGETLATFQKTLFDCINIGIHEDFEIYNFSLLPNSPANSPEFRKANNIKTIFRLMHSESIEDPLKQNLSYEELVIATSSYSKIDWINFYLWKCFIESFHKMGLTRIILMGSQSMEQDYLKLFSELFTKEYAKYHFFLKSELEDFISGKKHHNKIATPGLGYLDPEDWLFTTLIQNYETLIDQVSIILNTSSDRVEFQKKSFLRPELKRTETFIGRNYLNSKNNIKQTLQFEHPYVEKLEYLLKAKKRLYKHSPSNLFIEPTPL